MVGKPRPGSVPFSGTPTTIFGLKWMNSIMTLCSKDDDKHDDSPSTDRLVFLKLAVVIAKMSLFCFTLCFLILFA